MLIFACLPVALLAVAHFIIVIRANLPSQWLLAATLLIPAPFAFVAFRRSRGGLGSWGLVYLISAILAVLVMNIITAVAYPDQSSILPRSHADAIDDLEFTASIFFSFTSGLLASYTILSMQNPAHQNIATTKLNLAALLNKLMVASSPASLEKVSRYITSAGTIVSALGAIYLGLRRL